ncbi:14404_t:CDS:2, partial [Entrophospora sp. SA101]
MTQSNKDPCSILNYCVHVVNIDDFHDIHEKRRPDTTSLSTVKHFASCVSKKVEYPPVLAINNGIHVHNANNIEGNKIKGYLNTKYKGIFDISYNSHKSVFIDKFKKTYQYPYEPHQIEFLVQKTKHLIERSFKEKFLQYYLASLECIVDRKCLPTGYHTTCTPSSGI